jgi:adenylate cyclase
LGTAFQLANGYLQADSESARESTVSREAVRTALDRLLASSQFVNSRRARRFIRFVVEAALDGRRDELKEYLLGVEVFDRQSSFDPRIDTIVRVEAVKLRKLLNAYYRNGGRREPLVIEMPKGRYVPEFRFRKTRTPVARARRSKPAAVAVLPFISLSSDPGIEHWSDGLADEVISALSWQEEIGVVSRTSTFAFKGKTADVRDIGRLLGADIIVEGSVRSQDTRIRVSVQLTRVSSGVHFWCETIDRDMQDAWTVQEEVAQAIVAGIRAESASNEPGQIAARYRVHSGAFSRFLEARQLALACGCPPLLGVARAQLHIEPLPGPPVDFVPRAKELLDEALKLDPGLAEAHALMGSLIARHEWNWPEAERHFQRALALNPWSPEVHGVYAMDYLLPMGRSEEALVAIRRARELDSSAPHLARGLIYILMVSRRIEEAERECRRLLGQHGEDTIVRFYLAFMLEAQGRYQESLDELDLMDAGHMDLGLLAVAYLIRARCGDRRAAQELLTRLTDQPHPEFVRAMTFVFLHLALGENEEALLATEQAVRNREHGFVGFKTCHLVDPIRNHPRFQALLRQLNFA